MKEIKPTTETMESDQDAKNQTQVDESRRQFTKVSAIATSGVLITLASRPVLANQCSISGMQSGNTSHPGMVTCEGCTPGFYLNPNGRTRWSSYTPGNCVQKHSGHGACEWDNSGTKFHSVFNGDLYGNLTMAEVIQLTGQPGNDKYQLGAHAVASLLNALRLPNFGYTSGDIITMWNTYYASHPEQLKTTFQQLNERNNCPL
ncbi:MAG: hypothetical protein HZA59_13915 [Hydrogenophilales bacterium]|nr:hypothetical protein [Hydrogenophilales bacterium]